MSTFIIVRYYILSGFFSRYQQKAGSESTLDGAAEAIHMGTFVELEALL